jgi:hypothetical protein
LEKVLEIQADSLDDARRQAAQSIPAGLYLWSEEVLADGKPQTVTANADTEEAALAAVAAKVPADTQATNSSIRIAPSRRVVETEAWDEAYARAQVEQQLDSTSRIEAVRLKTAGKPGFLGFGKKKALYEADVFQSAVAVAEYKLSARMRIRMGDSKVPDRGFCQMCGKPEGQAKSYKGTTNFYCSSDCEKEYVRACIRAQMAGAIIVGINKQQWDEVQAAAAGDRGFCWSCGKAMPMSAKTCPACGKDQTPKA